MYFAGLQRHFIMMALVDCALAKLIAVAKIFSADIYVYARAIENMIDLVLMRSRAESELASMGTSIEVLTDLKAIWEQSGDRDLLSCSLDSANGSEETQGVLKVKGLAYTRGSASVRLDDLSLLPGIYAVTGANGSGKSTLFRLLMGCDTNRKPIDISKSINLKSHGTIQMPSADVVEIAQNFYWPLFTTPVDWVYHTDVSKLSQEDQDLKITRMEEQLRALKLYPETVTNTEMTNTLREDITTEQEDWFENLSGGQKSKVELVRKVFLADQCPPVLLIDETFAPLDPDSKNLVMQRLKDFCNESVMLVIYHADVQEGDEEETCVQSSNFFDNNLHVEDGVMSLRPVCVELSS